MKRKKRLIIKRIMMQLKFTNTMIKKVENQIIMKIQKIMILC